MMVLVSYDVCTIDSGGRSRLRKVAKECVNYGQRVQNSVFEIDTDYGTFLKVKDKLLKLVDIKQDSLRFYYLGNNWEISCFGEQVGKGRGEIICCRHNEYTVNSFS